MLVSSDKYGFIVESTSIEYVQINHGDTADGKRVFSVGIYLKDKHQKSSDSQPEYHRMHIELEDPYDRNQAVDAIREIYKLLGNAS